MKIGINFFLVLLIDLLSNCLNGQSNSPLEKIYNFKFSNNRLDQIITVVSKNSGVNISFDQKIVEQFHIPPYNKDKNLLQFFDEILDQFELGYKVITDEQIVIYSKKFNRLKIYKIYGRVADSLTKELLSFAHIYDKTNQTAVYTNEYGYFTLLSKHELAELKISYLGYEAKTIKINTKTNIYYNIYLKPSNTLPLITVTDRSGQPPAMYVEESGTVSSAFIKRNPTTFSDQDLFRSISTLSGISSGADGFGGMNVRGGSYDQNQILIDDVPIFYSSHAIGLLSIVDVDAIRNVQFYKERFSSQYGGRLSSVTDIYTKEGSLSHWSGQAQIGLLSGKFSINGPLIKNKLGFYFSTRRTLIDPFLKNITSFFKNDAGKIGITNYYFYDINTKINWTLSPKTRIYFSYYRGKDLYNNDDLFLTTDLDVHSTNRKFSKLNWRNHLSSIRLNTSLAKNVFLKSVAYRSEFNSGFETLDGFLLTQNSIRIDSLIKANSFYSNIVDYGTTHTIDWKTGNSNNIKFGISFHHQSYKPGIYSYNERSGLIHDLISFNPKPIDSILTKNSSKLLQQVCFVEDEYKFNELFQLKIGTRFSYLFADQTTFFSAQPRISFNFVLSDQLKFGISYDRNEQVNHLISSNGLGLPTDLWIPADSGLKPQKSNQFSAYTSIQIKESNFIRLNAYLKYFSDLVHIKEGTRFILDEQDFWKEFFITGKGESKGIELQYDKNFRRSTLSLNYHFSQSTRIFDQLNDGHSFNFKYARPHQFKCNYQIQFSDELSLLVGGEIASGSPSNIPKGKYNYISFENGQLVDKIFVYENINDFTLPYLAHLDLGIRYNIKKTWGTHEFYFGVYNALNRRNPIFLELKPNPSLPDADQFKQVNLLPILPSISYKVIINQVNTHK